VSLGGGGYNLGGTESLKEKTKKKSNRARGGRFFEKTKGLTRATSVGKKEGRVRG